MVTLEKLRIYKMYSGDGDHYTRTNRNRGEQILENGDFSTIDNLLQDIKITNKGLSSETYLKTLSEKLVEICDSAETINELKRMASIPNL